MKETVLVIKKYGLSKSYCNLASWNLHIHEFNIQQSLAQQSIMYPQFLICSCSTINGISTNKPTFTGCKVAVACKTKFPTVVHLCHTFHTSCLLYLIRKQQTPQLRFRTCYLPGAVISLTLYFCSACCCKHWLSKNVTQTVIAVYMGCDQFPDHIQFSVKQTPSDQCYS